MKIKEKRLKWKKLNYSKQPPKIYLILCRDLKTIYLFTSLLDSDNWQHDKGSTKARVADELGFKKKM